MAYAGAIMWAAGAVVGAVGNALAMYSVKRTAEYNKEIAKYKIAVEGNRASTAMMQARFQAKRIREQNNRILASQRAGYAKAGIDLAYGTPTDVARDSATQGELNALVEIYTGQFTVADSTVRADLLEADSEFEEKMTKFRMMSMGLSHAGQTLQSAGQMTGSQSWGGGSYGGGSSGGSKGSFNA